MPPKSTAFRKTDHGCRPIWGPGTQMAIPHARTAYPARRLRPMRRCHGTRLGSRVSGFRCLGGCSETGSVQAQENPHTHGETSLCQKQNERTGRPNRTKCRKIHPAVISLTVKQLEQSKPGRVQGPGSELSFCTELLFWLAVRFKQK